MMITNLKNPEKTLKPQFETLYEQIFPQKCVEMMSYQKDQIDTTMNALRYNPYKTSSQTNN